MTDKYNPRKTLYIPQDVYKWVRKQAKKEKTSVSYIMARAVRQVIKKK
jgi:predicted CopG family antitoxin